MAVNKVIYGDRTLVDLTQDSVNEDNLLEGETAHDASGNPVTGTAKQGHIVQNDSGTDMTQRSKVQFVGVYSEDDATNDRTKVNIVREMTSTQMQSLTTAQKKGFIHTTDEPDNPYVPSLHIDALADNVKTNSQLLNEIHSQIDYTKLSDKSCLVVIASSSNYVFHISYWSDVSATFDYIARGTQASCKISSSSSRVSYNATGVETDESSRVEQTGTIYRLIY